MTERLTNRQIEDLAIQYVLAQERAAGRRAFDTRGHSGASCDIDGDRLIEVKAYGTTARGSDLWLEPPQVEAALAEPERFHLVLVENIRAGEPSRFRMLDIAGARLMTLLDRRRERRYFVVPFPTGDYDALAEG